MNDSLNANATTIGTEEGGNAPVMGGLDAPKKWNYDEDSAKLTMLYKDGEVTRLLKSRAIIEEDNEVYRIAVLENSRRVCLFYSNQSDKLKAI